MSKANERSTHRRFIRIHGRLISQRFLRKTDADHWYAGKKREKERIESGLQPISEPLSLATYAARWMATRKAQGKPESSWKTDERRLRIHILPTMGSLMLQQIVRREWEAFFEQLVTERGLNPKTRNRIHALMSKMYNDSLRQEIVTVNPLVMIPKMRESQEAWDYWHTAEECQRYLEAAGDEGPMFRLFAAIALNTGARIGEVMAIRHEDARLDQRSLHIWRTYEQETGRVVERTKGYADRWLGINDALYEAIAKYRKATAHGPEDLLIRLENDKPVHEWTIRLRHQRTCTRAGLKPIRVHDLRHTYASHYVMNGGSLADLQALLGHSTSMMTMKYAHLTPGHLKAKASLVNFGAVSGLTPPQNVLRLAAGQS